MKGTEHIVNSIRLNLPEWSSEIRVEEDFFFKDYNTMLKKQLQSSASSNGRIVHNGPTFLQIIILWTKYYTINVSVLSLYTHTHYFKAYSNT